MVTLVQVRERMGSLATWHTGPDDDFGAPAPGLGWKRGTAVVWLLGRHVEIALWVTRRDGALTMADPAIGLTLLPSNLCLGALSDTEL